MVQGCQDLSLACPRSNSLQCSQTQPSGAPTVNTSTATSTAQRRRPCLTSALASPRSNSLTCGQGQPAGDASVTSSTAQRRRPCSVSDEDGQGQTACCTPRSDSIQRSRSGGPATTNITGTVFTAQRRFPQTNGGVSVTSSTAQRRRPCSVSEEDGSGQQQTTSTVSSSLFHCGDLCDQYGIVDASSLLEQRHADVGLDLVDGVVDRIDRRPAPIDRTSPAFAGAQTTSRRVNFDDLAGTCRPLCHCGTEPGVDLSPPPYYFKLSRQTPPPATAVVSSSTDRSPLIVGRPPTALTSDKQRHADVIVPASQCCEQFK